MLKNYEISENEAIRIISPADIQEITNNKLIKVNIDKIVKVKGIPASTGVATGYIALNKEIIRKLNKQHKSAILVDDHIDPNDVDTLFSSVGVVTTKGGSASHMAIIMRAAEKPGIVGAQSIVINHDDRYISIGNKIFNEGDPISIDGNTGEIFFANLKIKKFKSINQNQLEILNKRDEILGRSPWSSACYKVKKEFQRSNFIEKIRNVSNNLTWKSTKARVVEIINSLIPQEYIIQSKVLKPNDTESIKRAFIEVLKDGFENSPRTTHYPERLSGAPWAFGPNKVKDIDDFIFGNWDGKYFGLKNWLDDDLEAIIIGKEPKEKMNPEKANEHFAFTVTMLTGNPFKLIISINTGSPHLMSVLDVELGISVLVGQGRIEDKEVKWILVYGVKGSEEKEAVRGML